VPDAAAGVQNNGLFRGSVVHVSGWLVPDGWC
jgi:hypothetical protein